MNYKKLSNKLCLLSLLVSMTCSQVQAQLQDPGDVPLNNLRLTNRAQCALDSDQPTESAFMVVDSYNAGKLANSLAKNVGRDPMAFSEKGMRDFRISVTRLARTIIQRLLNGSLPILPLNLKMSKLAKYNSLAEKCTGKTYCPELNSYLSRIWDNSEGAGVQWNQIDNFSGASFLKIKETDRVGCYYIKKFSSLQGHLHSTNVDKSLLQDMAQSVLEKDKYITSCENTDNTLDSRNSIIQLDLKVSDYKDFANSGFDFWNSVKIYLSFAWRYSDIPSQVSPEFGELFKSIALEESIMMIPNGCKSIEKPECDGETLSMNSLRELAKPGGDKGGLSKEVPNGPDQEVISHGARSVNDDFLGTKSFQDASDWVDNFRKNYVQTRGTMKNRAQSAIQFMNLLSSSMTPADLTEFVRPLAFAKAYSAPHRDELYYLCTEARLAGDQRIDFMKSGIDRIKDLTVMQKAFEGSKKSLQDLVNYFDQVSEGVLPFCEALEKQNIWNVPNYQVNRLGFNAWARELLNIPNSNAVVPEVQPMAFGAPLLVWNQEKLNEAGNVICLSAIDCARKMTKAMVDLYAVAKYADAFLPVSPTVASPDVFNPYAELKACKIYDPWYQTRRANKRLFADLASTALFGWNFLPLYIDIDFKAPRVISLNQMIQNGSLKFDPKVERSQMQTSLLADFGPLMGAPCAVSIAPNSAKEFNFYAFNGISVNYCNIKSDGTAVGSTGGQVENSTPASRSVCGGCSINFVGVASSSSVSAGMALNPIKLGVYLFRAISRFLSGKSDDVNIPSAHEVNLAKVVSTYQKFGKIPDYCVEQLGLGYGCYQTLCTAKAADFFERISGKKVKTILLYNGPDAEAKGPNTQNAYITSDLCNGEVQLKFYCSEDGAEFSTLDYLNGLSAFSSECRRAIGNIPGVAK